MRHDFFLVCSRFDSYCADDMVGTRSNGLRPTSRCCSNILVFIRKIRLKDMKWQREKTDAFAHSLIRSSALLCSSNYLLASAIPRTSMQTKRYANIGKSADLVTMTPICKSLSLKTPLYTPGIYGTSRLALKRFDEVDVFVQQRQDVRDRQR